MSGHRHAASVLYGVSPQDQEAILGALPEADQRVLREYLLELRTLGFEPAAMRSATAALGMPAAPAQNVQAATPAARLHCASPTTMRALLEHEPDALLADVLALASWPWSAPLLASLPGPRTVALRMLAPRPEPTPALRALLLAELDRMAAAAPQAPVAGPDAVAPAVPRRTLSQRWAAWTR